MSGYDAWKTDVGDWPSVEDPPCPDCGAAPEEDCAPDCACAHCVARRERQTPDAACTTVANDERRQRTRHDGSLG